MIFKKDSTADINIIILLLECLFTMLLVWGICTQFSRIAGLSLLNTGVFASCCMLVSIAVWMKKNQTFLTKGDKTGLGSSLIALVIVSLIIAFLRSKITVVGIDALHYMSRPSFHIAHPDYGLTFNIPGQLPMGKDIVNGYWIPYTLEYLLGFISVIFSFDLTKLIFTVFPSFILFLAPFPVYVFFRRLSIGPVASILLALLTFAFLLLDCDRLNNYGGMALLRTYENKGLLIALGLPVFWLFLIEGLLKNQTGAHDYWRVFVVSFALCLTSMTAIYLIIVSAFLIFLSVIFVDLIASRKILFSNIITYTKLGVMTYIGPLIMLGLYIIYDNNSSKSANIVWKIFWKKKADPDFYYMWTQYFGNIPLLSGIIIFLLVIMIFFAGIKKNKIYLLTAIWFSLYSIILFNPFTFKVLKAISKDYISFMRLFCAFPLFWLPAIALGASLQFNKSYLKPVTLSLVIFVFCVQLFHQTGPVMKYIRSIDQNTDEYFASSSELHNFITSSYIKHDDYVLANRTDASKMVFKNPTLRQLSIHGYFLLGRADTKESFRNCLSIIKAQRYIHHSSARYKAEFLDVLDRYEPKAIIPKGRAVEKVKKVLDNSSYKLMKAEKEWAIFIKV